MITKENVDLSLIIYERMKNLHKETFVNNFTTNDQMKHEMSMKTELTEILMDVQNLQVSLYKIWRDVR